MQGGETDHVEPTQRHVVTWQDTQCLRHRRQGILAEGFEGDRERIVARAGMEDAIHD